MELEYCRESLEKFTITKFHEYPSSAKKVVPCEQKNRQTDTTQVIVAFRNFAKTPKKYGAHQNKNIKWNKTLVFWFFCTSSSK
jgi:hypothetical protein